VSTVIMPSRYSSSATQQDARDLAAALGARARELPIESVVDSYSATLEGEFTGSSTTSPRRTCRRGSAATC